MLKKQPGGQRQKAARKRAGQDEIMETPVGTMTFIPIEIGSHLCEKMLDLTNRQRNANQNHSELSPHTR